MANTNEEVKKAKKEDEAPAAEVEALKERLAELEKERDREVEALKKQLKEQQKPSAETSSPDATVDRGEERVKIKLFRDSNRYSGDVFVAVNGEACLIRRGAEVEVKRKFADVVQESLRQDQETAEMIERESAAYDEQVERYKI